MNEVIKIQVEKRDGFLVPITADDAMLLEDFPRNSLFSLKPTKKRSHPMINMYWATLRKVCRATDRWPSVKHLHREIKIINGYYTKAIINGDVYTIPDSVAFDAMTQDEFNLFFERAMLALDGGGYLPPDLDS